MHLSSVGFRLAVLVCFQIVRQAIYTELTAQRHSIAIHFWPQSASSAAAA